MSAHKFVATAQNFVADVIEASHKRPVLVDFWADWCGPCKQLMPILDRVADEYAGRFALAKVNTDEQQELSARVGVRSLPTVVLFKGGQAVDHFVGAVPEGHVRQLLERHLAPAEESPLDRARTLKNAGDLAGARALLDPELANDPKNIALQGELAELDVLAGDLDAARGRLQHLQAREPQHAIVKRLAALIEFQDVVKRHPDPHGLMQRLRESPTDAEARHALAVHRLLAGDYDAALTDWLELLRSDRQYGDGLARKSLVRAFEMLGEADPRVPQARRAMAQILF